MRNRSIITGNGSPATRLCFLFVLLSLALLPAGTRIATASELGAGSYRFVLNVHAHEEAVTDPKAAPVIYEIDLNEREFSSHGTVRARVIASVNTDGVYAHVGRIVHGIPPVQNGLFEGADDLPGIPLFLRGRSYIITFEAVTKSGKSILVDVPIYIKR